MRIVLALIGVVAGGLGALRAALGAGPHDQVMGLGFMVIGSIFFVGACVMSAMNELKPVPTPKATT